MTQQISEHFTFNEFADPTTGETKFPFDFVEHLEALRRSYNKPMIVTSGCRSAEHNEWLQRRGYAASPNSFHLMENEKYNTGGCIAFDIARPNGYDLRHLIKVAIKQGWTVGLAKTFVHLDLRAKFTTLEATFYTY